MFGYVVVNPKALEEPRRDRYRAFYCGLCRTLGERYGLPARLALTYDMTFLILLLGSLYEPEERADSCRCLPHPARRHACVTTRFTGYAAALNVLLAYYNCEDDWHDERSAPKHAAALLLRRRLPLVRRAYPRQFAAAEGHLAALARIEADNGSADEAANRFALLMGELFVSDEADHFAPALRRFGEGLGRFVYLMDACLDVREDARRGRYNPLLPLAAQPEFDARCHELLTALIGEAAAEFESLPLVQDVDILRNILYSGVWTRYALMQQQRQKERNDR